MGRSLAFTCCVLLGGGKHLTPRWRLAFVRKQSSVAFFSVSFHFVFFNVSVVKCSIGGAFISSPCFSSVARVTFDFIGECFNGGPKLVISYQPVTETLFYFKLLINRIDQRDSTLMAFVPCACVWSLLFFLFMGCHSDTARNGHCVRLLPPLIMVTQFLYFS